MMAPLFCLSIGKSSVAQRSDELRFIGGGEAQVYLFVSHNQV